MLFFIRFSTLPPSPVCLVPRSYGFFLISGRVFSLPKLFDFGHLGCQEVSKKHISPITCTFYTVWEKSN